MESGRRDSDPRPTAWNAVTLPTELLPQKKQWAGGDSNLRRHKSTDLQSAAFDRFATYPTSTKN